MSGADVEIALGVAVMLWFSIWATKELSKRDARYEAWKLERVQQFPKAANVDLSFERFCLEERIKRNEQR